MSKEKETVVSEVVVADNAVEATETTVVTAEDVVKKAIDDAAKVAEDALLPNYYHCRLIGVRMQILLQTLC